MAQRSEMNIHAYIELCYKEFHSLCHIVKYAQGMLLTHTFSNFKSVTFQLSNIYLFE